MQAISNVQKESKLAELLTIVPQRLDNIFANLIKTIPAIELKNALEYSLNNGGKRLRPLLVYASGSIFNAPWENMDIAAAAIELIHTYSLIHDDLPCMDNADLRRGKPTCHKLFGEDMAVLVGDALQTLAFNLITHFPAPLSTDRRLQMINTLSQASGAHGMVAGQAFDIRAMQQKNISASVLEEIYYLKTGTLFSAALQLGWLSSDNHDEKNKQALIQFADCIGLAFQIQDDILDIESSAALSGKPSGLDAKNNKITYASLHGIDSAKNKVKTLYQQGLDALHSFGENANLLRELAEYMLVRKK